MDLLLYLKLGLLTHLHLRTIPTFLLTKILIGYLSRAIQLEMMSQAPIPTDSVFTKDWEELHLENLFNTDHSIVNTTSLIANAIESDDIPKLSEFARSRTGLVSPQLRSRAWAALMSLDKRTPCDGSLLLALELNDSEPHKDEDQVLLDIKRLFTVMWHMNSFNHEINSSYTTILSPDDIKDMRKRLYYLIVKVLRKYPCLNYYQGFHDVASVVLIVCYDLNDHDEQAFAILENLALYHLRDFMNPHMGLSINHLKLIPLVLEKVDQKIFQLVRQTSSSYSATYGLFFDYKFYPALLATLTMYSHDLANLNHVMLIWDFILSYKSISASAYIYVSFITHFKPRILEELGVKDLADLTSADADLVHNILSPNNLFSGLTDSDILSILTDAASYIESWPLDELFATSELAHLWFKEFNVDSVVVTTSELKGGNNNSLRDLTLTIASLSSLLDLQEKQQCKESSYDMELFQKAMEQESMAASISSLEEGTSALSLSLLSKSLSNLTAVSSSLNTRLTYTSSVILKKLAMLSDDLNDDKPANKDISSLRPNILKISLAIGLIGFILHFLVKHSEVLHDSSAKNFYALIRRIGSSLNNDAIWSNSLFVRTSKIIKDTVSSLKASEFAKIGRYVSEVGLGNVRKSVYAFEQMN